MLVRREEAHGFFRTLAEAVTSPYNVFSPPLNYFGNRVCIPLSFGDERDFRLEKHFVAALVATCSHVTQFQTRDCEAFSFPCFHTFFFWAEMLVREKFGNL